MCLRRSCEGGRLGRERLIQPGRRVWVHAPDRHPGPRHRNRPTGSAARPPHNAHGVPSWRDPVPGATARPPRTVSAHAWSADTSLTRIIDSRASSAVWSQPWTRTHHPPMVLDCRRSPRSGRLLSHSPSPPSSRGLRFWRLLSRSYVSTPWTSTTRGSCRLTSGARSMKPFAKKTATAYAPRTTRSRAIRPMRPSSRSRSRDHSSPCTAPQTSASWLNVDSGAPTLTSENAWAALRPSPAQT